MPSIFRLPTRTIIAPGSLAHLETEIAAFDAARPFLVFDQGLSQTRWPSIVQSALESVYGAVRLFSEIEPNPRAETVDRATRAAREFGSDIIVGIGGGSVLDAAKAVAMLLRNEGSCTDYEGKNLFQYKPVPFIAVPTTCGTGSEVTWVSVISDTANKRKISVKGDGMFPRLAIVDADLIQTLPPPLIAQTGLDALTHALEAFVSKCANPVSDVLAMRATHLILTHLARCVDVPDDPESRREVMKASTLAGIAFGNADVGAVHCLSESIGGLFDQPHGLLNAQLLVPVFRYQLSTVVDRLESIRGVGSAEELLDDVERLVEQVGIPSFSTHELSQEAIGNVARLAEHNNSNASNPMVMTANDYEKILKSIV